MGEVWLVKELGLERRALEASAVLTRDPIRMWFNSERPPLQLVPTNARYA
jgi:hypothetical protein